MSNSAAVFSNELLQTISNQVQTTILPDPSLTIQKYPSKEEIASNEPFEWNIDYLNNSGNTNTGVFIEDVLDPRFDLLEIRHVWNEQAVDNGNPSAETVLWTAG